jgi:transcriptional repressor NrdR
LQKRPFSSEEIDKIVSDVEARVYRFAKDKDIRSSKVGEFVMAKLKRVDKVAYVRFAAVYRDFADIDDFRKEIKKLR